MKKTYLGYLMTFFLTLATSANAAIYCDAESADGCQFHLDRLSSVPITLTNMKKGKNYSCFALPTSLNITNINFTFAGMVGMRVAYGNKASILKVDNTDLRYREASLYFDVENRYIDDKLAYVVCYVS